MDQNQDLLHRAVLVLAGNCDGAYRRDDIGFNRYDAPLGKLLAGISPDIWTPAQKRSAWKMLRKYRKQLAGSGIDYDAIPEPRTTREGDRSIRLRNEIEISFPYSARLVAEVKELPGRRWNMDRKVWTVPATRLHAAAVIAFAHANDFEYDEPTEFLAQQTATDGTADFVLPVHAPQGRSIAVNKDRAILTFPFDADIVEEVKKIPGRQWDKASRVWTVPLTQEALTVLLSLAELNDFGGDIERIKELAGKVSVLAQEAIEASQASTADFEVEGLGGELRPFQKAGARYAVEKQRLIIGDEMGLGKTVQALAVIQHLQTFPALIICPASLKFNWLREGRKWLPGKSFQVLGGETVGRADANLTIINYDRLKDYREFLIRRGFKAIIGDESQALKSPTAQRTIFFEEIANGCLYGRRGKKADRRAKEKIGEPIPIRMLLTGTPVMNRPNELISQLQILDRLQDFGGWWAFNNEYCGIFQSRWGMDNSGAKNLKKLNDLLRARCFVRRTKADVLKELPAKQRTIVPTELTNRHEYQKAEANLIAWLRETAGQAKADAAARAEQLVRIEALKQLSARGKLSAIKEWVEDFIDTGEKLVVFAWHREVVDELARTFRCKAIHGGISPEKRQPIVDEFQNDPDVKVIVMNVQSGGVGLTLTAASNVAFCELGWNPAQHGQAEDRVHRIGQTDSVMAWYFIGTKTIDETIHELIESKRSVVDAVTDGIERTDDVSVLNELVDRLLGDDKTIKATDGPRRAANDFTGEPNEFELF